MRSCYLLKDCVPCSYGAAVGILLSLPLVGVAPFVLFVCFVLVVGLFSTAAMKAYCTLTPPPPNEFRNSSPEALHIKRRERPLLAKDGTKTEKFS
jgi:hypothetical protein